MPGSANLPKIPSLVIQSFSAGKTLAADSTDFHVKFYESCYLLCIELNIHLCVDQRNEELYVKVMLYLSFLIACKI